MKYIEPLKQMLPRVLFLATAACIFAWIVATVAGIPYASVPGLALKGIIDLAQEAPLITAFFGGLFIIVLFAPGKTNWSMGGGD